MEFQLALSAERLSLELARFFPAIGLIRSEYLCRKIFKYFPDEKLEKFIDKYITCCCKLFANKPVWYRFSELDATEINILDNPDAIIDELNPLLGTRGVRRACRYPDTFDHEARIISQLAERNPNLHVLIPFISNLEELFFVKNSLKKYNYRNKIGIMAEIPEVCLNIDEFLKCGVQHVLVGMNDLGMLIGGGGRGSHYHKTITPGTTLLLQHIRELTFKNHATLAIAGYINKETIELAKELKFDASVIHYSDLNKIFPERFRNLKDIDLLKHIKIETKAKIMERHLKLIQDAQSSPLKNKLYVPAVFYRK